MNSMELITESLHAAKLEIEEALKFAPVVRRADAFRVGNLLRLTGASILSRHGDLPENIPPPRTEPVERDLFRA